MSNSNIRPDENRLSAAEKEFENSIRPKEIVDFSGQEQIIVNLEGLHQSSQDCAAKRWTTSFSTALPA